MNVSAAAVDEISNPATVANDIKMYSAEPDYISAADYMKNIVGKT
ncbi:MAG: hypothetical protein Q4G33_14185 [bacterium]|nr:hypothetical protein [bacterium]